MFDIWNKPNPGLQLNFSLLPFMQNVTENYPHQFYYPFIY